MGNRLGIDASGSIIRVAASLLLDHPNVDTFEGALLDFLPRTDIWTLPWLFDYKCESGRPGRVYCFILDFSQADKFIPVALKCISKLFAELNISEPWIFKGSITGSAHETFESKVRECQNEFNVASTERTYLTVSFTRLRELKCVVNSVDFLLRTVPRSLFHYEKTHKGVTDAGALPPATDYRPEYLDQISDTDFYPYLLVNLKAGVSFHKISSPTTSERVGGSPIGFATFVGLTRLLCGSNTSPLDAFMFAQKGDQSTVDLLVRDIYGGDYDTIGLKGSYVASTLGKMQAIDVQERELSLSSDSTDGKHCAIPLKVPHLCSYLRESPDTRDDDKADSLAAHFVVKAGVRCRYALRPENEGLIELPDIPIPVESSEPRVSFESRPCEPLERSMTRQPSEADVAKSLLSMVTFNVTQLAYLNAVLYKCKRIIFIGYYLELPDYLAAIQHCIDYWSSHGCPVHFTK